MRFSHVSSGGSQRMKKTRLFLVVGLVVAAAFILSAGWFFLTEKPESIFVDLPNILRVIATLEEERDRKALGLESRKWKTPTRKLFNNEALQQVCRAIANVDSKVLEKLLDSNLDLNEVGEDGLTVLFFAYMEGNFPSFLKLLEKGAKPDFPLTRTLDVLVGHVIPQKGETVLLTACNPYERTRFLEAALKYTDDPNQRNAYGMTALHIFLSNYPFTGSEERLRAMLEAGIDPLATDNFGKTAIDYARTNVPQFLPVLESKQ